MADQAPTQDPPPSGSPPSDPAKPTTEGKGLLTADQVNEIVRSRIAEDRRKRPNGVKPEKPADPPPGAPTGSDGLEAKIAQLELRNAFDKRAAKFDLTDEASDDLFTLFAAKKPEDASVWFTDVARRFSLKPLGATQQPPAGNQPPLPQQPNNTHPITDRGGTPPPRVPLEEQDLARMSVADIEALKASKGQKWYEETLKRQMTGRRFVLPR